MSGGFECSMSHCGHGLMAKLLEHERALLHGRISFDQLAGNACSTRDRAEAFEAGIWAIQTRMW